MVQNSYLMKAENEARHKKRSENTAAEAVNIVQSVPIQHTQINQQHSHHHDQSNATAERKRKRTSIAAPEKRSLEAFFGVQPRPSGEKIAQIADKLDLKKNVVRVWFCNQRQKQKRMKFAAIQTR